MLRAISEHLRPWQPPPATTAPASSGAEAPLRLTSHTRADDPRGAEAAGLTDEEVAFFKQNGFLVKRRHQPRALGSCSRAPVCLIGEFAYKTNS